MSPVSKLCAALAVFGMLTLIALAPSAALAHGGHGHAAIETAIDISKSADATAEVYAADIVNPQAPHDHGCGDRGCCGNGHCAGCVTALAPSALAEFRMPVASLRLTFDAVLPPGLGTSGPSRPPRSFV